MDVRFAMRFIEALAAGTNPLSGASLPDESIYRHPDVKDALVTAVTTMETIYTRRLSKPKIPSREGDVWTKQEDLSLRKEFELRIEFAKMAEIHSRTRRAVTKRLEHLGLLRPFGPNTSKKGKGAIV